MKYTLPQEKEKNEKNLIVLFESKQPSDGTLTLYPSKNGGLAVGDVTFPIGLLGQHITFGFFAFFTSAETDEKYTLHLWL